MLELMKHLRLIDYLIRMMISSQMYYLFEVDSYPFRAKIFFPRLALVQMVL